MKILVLGDTHGSVYTTAAAIGYAVEHDVEKIIQVGDFGIWPGIKGMAFLDMVNNALISNNITLHFVDGNHEDFNQIKFLDKNNPRNEDGHVHYRTNILHIPRNCRWYWDSKLFMGIGGAASIDRRLRVENQSWWPGEQLSDDEVEGAVNIGNGYRKKDIRVDYLFTHDCSDKTPWGFQLIPDPASLAHRQKIDSILDAVRPYQHFHGHMHHKYQWINHYGEPFTVAREWTDTYGLDSDGQPYSMGILDTRTNRFEWYKW